VRAVRIHAPDAECKRHIHFVPLFSATTVLCVGAPARRTSRILQRNDAGDDPVGVSTGDEHVLRVHEVRHKVESGRWRGVQFERQCVARSGAGRAVASDSETSGNHDIEEHALIGAELRKVHRTAYVAASTGAADFQVPHVILFCGDRGVVVAANSCEVEGVVAGKTGKTERRAGLQLQESITHVALVVVDADVLDHAAARRVQIENERVGSELRICEGECAAAGASEAGVNRIGSRAERSFGNLRRAAIVVGIGKNTGQAAAAIRGETPDARERSGGSRPGR
jgi:hypothetical protein